MTKRIERLGGCSPQSPGAVSVECPFVRDENKFLDHRLRNQHAVERIAVRSRQRSGLLGMSKRDRQRGKALIDDASSNIDGDGGRSRKLSQAILGRDLPGGRRANKYVVGFVLDA